MSINVLVQKVCVYIMFYILNITNIIKYYKYNYILNIILKTKTLIKKGNNRIVFFHIFESTSY